MKFRCKNCKKEFTDPIKAFEHQREAGADVWIFTNKYVKRIVQIVQSEKHEKIYT